MFEELKARHQAKRAEAERAEKIRGVDQMLQGVAGERAKLDAFRANLVSNVAAGLVEGGGVAQMALLDSMYKRNEESRRVFEAYRKSLLEGKE